MRVATDCIYLSIARSHTQNDACDRHCLDPLRDHDLAHDSCLHLLYQCSLGKTTVADTVAHVQRIQPACTDTLHAFLYPCGSHDLKKNAPGRSN